MRLASTASVVPGTELARDVTVSLRPGHLLCAGVPLDEQLVASLLQNGVTRVWVKDDLAEGIQPRNVLGDRLHAETLAEVSSLHDAVRKALRTPRPRLDDRLTAGLARLSERMADDVIEMAGRPYDLLDLASFSRYLINHAVDSATLAMLIGARHMTTIGWRQGASPVRHDAPRAELARLGLGVLLCDIGMLAVPRAVLEAPGGLTDEAWEQIHRHPVLGTELLGSTTSFVLKGIVRSHHERWDGLGYPDGLAGEGIQRFARYAAVADAYDALTADRAHRLASTSAEAWQNVVDGAGTAFDPSVVAAFQGVVARHPLGTDVTLADGRVGVVCAVDLNAPLSPTVRVHEGSSVVELKAEVAPTAPAS
jgi:HD-GYP domain-containing protein (c-di-GMP phosphodiesterase class II)